MKSRTAMMVEQVLASSVEARNSDNELIIQMLQANGAELTPRQEEVVRGLVFESITRVRRKLQHDGKYLPSDAVVKFRRFKSAQVQQIAPSASANYIANTIDGRL